MGKAKRMRQKAVREGKLNPVVRRGTWKRKPQTQIVANHKAEQRRSWCRKTDDDDAVFLCVA